MASSPTTPALDTLYSQITDVDLDVSHLLSRKISTIADALKDVAADDRSTREQLLDLMANSTANLFEHIHRLRDRSPEEAAKLAGWVSNDIEQLAPAAQTDLFSKIKKHRSDILSLIAGFESLIIIHNRFFPETTAPIVVEAHLPSAVQQEAAQPIHYYEYQPRRTWNTLPGIGYKDIKWKTLRRGDKVKFLGHNATHFTQLGMFMGPIAFESADGTQCDFQQWKHAPDPGNLITMVSCRGDYCQVKSKRETKYIIVDDIVPQRRMVTNAVLHHLDALPKEKGITIYFRGFSTECQQEALHINHDISERALYDLIGLGFRIVTRI